VRLLWLHGDPPVRPGRFLYNASLQLYRVLTIIGGCDPTVTQRSTRPVHYAVPLACSRPTRSGRARVAADVWFEPTMVLEVLAAELTVSPNHTAGWNALMPELALAMLFSWFTRGRW
jgi:hypothetical protein